MSPAVSLANVSFSYQNQPVLENVNLTIHPGEFIGIVGPNGGGKTTLFKLLMGFLSPQKGSISLFGKSREEMRTQIGYVPQRLQIDPNFPITVEEVVLLGATSGISYSKEIKERALDLLETFALLPYRKAPFSSLSGGLLQKTLFARALLLDPPLLLFDEPTANVDSKSSLRMLDQMESFKKKKTLLLITHDLRTVIERVDRIVFVEKTVRALYPKEVCEHFALGLYHTPLLDHFPLEGIDAPPCLCP